MGVFTNMVCENYGSSSTAQPPTEYILNALKEFLIHHLDPSDIGIDLEDGLREKEEAIETLTHDLLLQEEPDYFELEAKVAQLFGKSFTDYLIGSVEVQPPNIQLIPPEIYYSETGILESYITGIFLNSVVTGGNVPIEDFSYSWQLISGPAGEEVFFSDNTSLNTFVSFSDIGTYGLRMSARHNQYGLLVIASVTVNVTEESSSSSSSGS